MNILDPNLKHVVIWFAPMNSLSFDFLNFLQLNSILIFLELTMFVLWNCLVQEATLGGSIVATSGSTKTFFLLNHIGNCLVWLAVAILKDCHSNSHNHSWHIKTRKDQTEGSHSIGVVASTHKRFCSLLNWKWLIFFNSLSLSLSNDLPYVRALPYTPQT